MASLPSEVRTSYPLMTYNFTVKLGGAQMSFAEVSGLAREYETVTYRHGLTFREGEDIVKYRIDRYVPITMKRGSMIKGTELHAWLEHRGDRALEIQLCDEEGDPVFIWTVAKAVAVKLTAPNFDAASNEVAIETLEVMGAGISVAESAVKRGRGGLDAALALSRRGKLV